MKKIYAIVCLISCIASTYTDDQTIELHIDKQFVIQEVQDILNRYGLGCASCNSSLPTAIGCLKSITDSIIILQSTVAVLSSDVDFLSSDVEVLESLTDFQESLIDFQSSQIEFLNSAIATCCTP